MVGVEPLPSQGMEGRFAVKLRVQNPNENPVEFDGVSVTLDIRGGRLASGVSDVRGTVPRFGETVITVPVTVPVTAMVRQALGFATGDRTRLDYELRGRLAGSGFGGVRFEFDRRADAARRPNLTRLRRAPARRTRSGSPRPGSRGPPG